jgi:hypothetical protein
MNVPLPTWVFASTGKRKTPTTQSMFIESSILGIEESKEDYRLQKMGAYLHINGTKMNELHINQKVLKGAFQ